MNIFKKYNLIIGWACFLFAEIVYLMTMEPTASLWDCSEFIATSYKLEVGHPPGAPLFMMISRLFAIFAPDVTKVAVMVNAMSATASAVTIMFLFWTITHFARRMYKLEESEIVGPKLIAILGAGAVGAIAYAFTDTFWFSAVEGEVYALSSCFTAVALWAILKWENVADQPHSNRWIILIAYVTGLAIGVHLLNLLIIPAFVFVYYFKKCPEVTKWGVVKMLAISGALLIAMMFIIIPGTVSFGAAFDLFFVNTLGMPINSGMIFYVIALFALLGWGVWYTDKRGKVLANTIILCVTVITLGYGSYASVVIRAAANPPMNSNSPSNPYALLSLLNRDQYGARPLISGPYYSSPAIDVVEKETYYVGEDGKYRSATVVSGYKYSPEFKFFFPRMYSSKESDIKDYQNWGRIEGRKIKFRDNVVTVPTFGENMRYFFAYQLNFMYWRYFLWNFVGRQSDVQSTGELTDGNWLSGINFIDDIFLGPQKNVPSETANNKGRNKYYMLPLLLGILGLIYQMNRDGKNFTVVLTVFIMTGIAIVVYLNSPPSEPRERDYVFAGSFYAFAVWIGFGVLWLFGQLSKLMKKENVAAAAVATAVGCVVPAILGAQNWDDHDRSHRYVARDFGINYLTTALPNAVVMNYGDNDTFPLWYAQEVEGVRPDVRVMNMSYLGAEWYVDQMRIKSNDSEPVPFSLPREKYTYRNEFVMVNNMFDYPVDLVQAMDFIKSNDPRTQARYGDKMVDYLPAKHLALAVNKKNAIESGIVKEKDAHLMADSIYLTINKNSIDRSELMLLDLLATFDWKRPLYFTQPHSIVALGLRDYLQFDGFGYRVVPIRTPSTSVMNAGRIDPEVLYDNLMNKYQFGNVADPRVYADNTVQVTFNATHSRGMFARLAMQLAINGDNAKAIEVLDRGMEVIPPSQIRHSYILTVPVIEAYYMAGAMDKGDAVLDEYAAILKEYVSYYSKFTGLKGELVDYTLREKVSILYEVMTVARDFGRTDKAKEIETFFAGQHLM